MIRKFEETIKNKLSRAYSRSLSAVFWAVMVTEALVTDKDLFFLLQILYCVDPEFILLVCRMEPTLCRAYAKINLGLYVLERRPDGYHNIETVFHRIDLFDEIGFAQADEIIVRSSSPDAPGGAANICHAAATLLRHHLNIGTGVSITITKNIPVGAGLGGGSADAAIVLRELPVWWGRSVDAQTLQSLALQLGSDVPYFLGTGSALAKGRGEVLEYFSLDVPYTIVLCTPNIHISTAWAYQQILPDRGRTPLRLKELVTEGMQNIEVLAHGLRNSFEPAVFRAYPYIMEIKEEIMRGGGIFALLSGSGSSVYGFFPRSTHANDVARMLRARGNRVFLTQPHFSPG